MTAMTQPAIHRLIEGGNATFTAGCELATLHLNPVVGITSKVSMKADANTILITWRPTADSPPALLKGLLESVGGSLRFCHRATRGQRDKWQATTVAGFYHPEHAHAALKYMKGSLWLKGQQLYTVYITAPKDVSAAVLIDIEEIASQTDVDIAWEEPRQGKVTLRLSGTDKDAVVDMKGVTEAIFSGHIATTWSTCTSANSPSGTFEIWHDFFATAPGEIWIKYLERETGTLIRSDKLQQRLRSYSSGENSVHCSFIDQELRSQLEKLEDSQERQAIPLDTKQFRALVASDRVALAQRRLSKENVSLDLLNKTLVLHCSRKTAWLITHELGLAMPPPAPAKAEHECFHCGETTTDVKLSCGHVNCRECFDHQLHVASTDLTGNHFPLVCWHEICKEPIPIADLRKHTTGTTFDNLLKASLTYYVRSSPHKYRNCRTPDCKSVYLLQSSYEIFTCPTCLTQTCTRCHTEPHTGWTCTEYATHMDKSRKNEHLLDDYKRAAGTKDCPKCATLIEKTDGCNHIECSGCHGHICWVCMKVFTGSEAAYQHMNDRHGGNGLETVEGEEETEIEFEDEIEDEVPEYEDFDADPIYFYDVDPH